MKKHVRFTSGVLALALAFSSTSFAWNSRGHMMVAAVAYKKLNTTTKDRVEALLLLNPDRDHWADMIPASTSAANRKMMLFMIAATWSDRIKSDPDYHTDGAHNGNIPPTDGTAANNIGYDDRARHKYWHFIDLPFSTDGTPTSPALEPNAQTQLMAFRTVLASTIETDALKSYDLSWFLHLVGDVHQPLHCTARFTSVDLNGDDGGNDVKLTSPANLHSFWDGVLGSGESPSTALSSIVGLPNAPASAVNDLNINHWIDQSFAAAKTNVYKLPIGAGLGTFTLNATYKTSANNLAKKQIALAGARLAKILNEELK